MKITISIETNGSTMQHTVSTKEEAVALIDTSRRSQHE